jgi:hypothetical protein
MAEIYFKGKVKAYLAYASGFFVYGDLSRSNLKVNINTLGSTNQSIQRNWFCWIWIVQAKAGRYVYPPFMNPDTGGPAGAVTGYC